MVEVSLGDVVLETTEVVGVENSSIAVVVVKPTCIEGRRQQHHHPQHQNRHKHH